MGAPVCRGVLSAMCRGGFLLRLYWTWKLLSCCRMLLRQCTMNGSKLALQLFHLRAVVACRVSKEKVKSQKQQEIRDFRTKNKETLVHDVRC
jgi:hypothetical protein